MNPRVLSVLLLAGCVQGSGVLATETRSLGAFEAIDNQSFVQARLTIAAAAAATLTCDDNLLPDIRTTTEGQILRVTYGRAGGVAASPDCELLASTPRLTTIDLSGSGEVTVDGRAEDFERASSGGSGQIRLSDVRGDALRFELAASGPITVVSLTADDEVTAVSSGNGLMRLTGTAPSLGVTASGSGDVDARDLVARDVSVELAGSGDVEVFATGTVDVILQGSGDVVIYGGGTLGTETVTGSGRIRRR